MVLTETENLVLSLVQRTEPISAYGLRQLLRRSIVSRLRISNGTIYPLLKRLTERGLLSVRTKRSKQREADVYRATTAGRAAIRAWIQSPDGVELVLEDVARRKLLSMAVLSVAERVRWLRGLRQRMQDELVKLDEFTAKYAHLEFMHLAHDNARSTLVARIEWATRTLAQLEREQRLRRD